MAEGFEAAVDAVVSGDLATLQDLLAATPSLATARSARQHEATLLHYIAANGVEQERQRTSANAPQVVEALLAAGAEAEALSNIYGGGPGSATLHLLVTSAHPAKAGVQAEIARQLCEAGADPNGADGGGGPVRGALAFMYPPGGYYDFQYNGALETLRVLEDKGGRTDDVFAAIALGRPEQFVERVDGISHSKTARARAFALACLGGQVDMAARLLEIGVDVNGAYARDETGLHLAAATGQRGVAAFLVGRGAEAQRRDERFGETPAEWAARFGHDAVGKYLSRID